LEALAALDAPAVAARFGEVTALEHGAFYRGWRLLLLGETAHWETSSLDGADLSRRGQRAAIEAEQILAAVATSPTGYLESYPGRYWPCDTVVAVAAAKAMLPSAGTDRAVAEWVARVTDSTVSGPDALLPHEVDAEGGPVAGPRGSSQAIIQAFWPGLVGPAQAADSWAAFYATFVDRRLGVVGVREHPSGQDGGGDVDSGPLLLGLSPSASAVSIAAARAAGDCAPPRGEQTLAGPPYLAETLDMEVELLGLPFVHGGKRTYLLGALPVAEAFFAWADTTPCAPHPPEPGLARPQWDRPVTLMGLWAAAPAAAGAAALAWGLRKRQQAGGAAPGSAPSLSRAPDPGAGRPGPPTP
jgi:hypothetical protein